MAFGGNMAPAGALAPATVIQPSIPEAAAAANLYSAAGALRYIDGAGMEAGGGQKLLATLLYLMTDNGSPSTPVIAAYADITIDGSAADTGVFVTAVAAANQHGLPVNFGPGRGNWVLSDLTRLDVQIQRMTTSVAALTTNLLIPINLTLVAGDITIVIKNTSAQSLALVNIRLRYDHSVSF